MMFTRPHQTGTGTTRRGRTRTGEIERARECVCVCARSRAAPSVHFDRAGEVGGHVQQQRQGAQEQCR